MSSEHPGGAPSSELDIVALLRLRGAPLVEALELHMRGSREHSEATGTYVFAASVELCFERNQCEAVRQAAVLHEVGQVYVPATILAKARAERDEAEAAVVEAHHEAGYRLARGAGVPEHVCRWLLRVRERFDGGGPESLAAEQIPVESRLIRASCATATALAAARGGTEPPHRQAIAVLNAASGTELDPRLVDILSNVLARATTT